MKARIVLSLMLILSLFGTYRLDGQDIEAIIKDKNPVSWNGRVAMNTVTSKAWGIDTRTPFTWNLNAQLNGKLYFLDLPLGFSIGSNGRSLSRPYLQLGLSPSYKWARLYLGTASMKFSDFSLAGHTFDGVGLELTPGKWRIAAMRGRLRKARNFDAELDTRFQSIVYRRTGYGLKLGYGTNKAFIDLIYFKGEDDANSVTELPEVNNTRPGENAVLGVRTAFPLGKKISFTTEAAVSAYTRNTFSQESEGYIKPDLSSLLKMRYSTRVNYALKSALRFDFRRFGFDLQYERIMPEFETMGAYFFANDRERISIAPRLSLAQGRMQIIGSLGLERNNLLETKTQQTKQITGMINASYFSPKGFGISLNYSNLSVAQEAGLQELVDTFAVAVVSTNLSFIPNYTWADSVKSHNIALSGLYQNLNDKNPFTREFTSMNMLTINPNYTFALLQAGWSYNIGGNYTIIEFGTTSTARYGLNTVVTKTLPERNWSVNLSGSYNATIVEGQNDGFFVSSGVSLRFNTKECGHSFSFGLRLQHNNSKTFEDYTELFANAGYNYIIRSKKNKQQDQKL